MPLYKDVTPHQTVLRIQKILADLGITPVYAQTPQGSSFSPHCHWFGLESADYIGVPDGLAAGKGTSKMLALASAHAEFMERLQSGRIVNHRFGLMKDRYPAPDQVILKYGELNKRQKDHLQLLFDAPLEEAHFPNDYPLELVPFYNVTDKKVDLISHELIWFTSWSNGLCAGNTYEEALVQGICEVLERYSRKRILWQKEAISCPTIPLETIENEHTCVQLIQELEEMGYRIVIKDMTLNGQYPVVGTIVIHPETKTYYFNQGSDPWLSVAIERCITEVFLHVRGGDLPHSLKFPLEKDALPVRLDHGSCPPHLFFSSGEPKLAQAFKNHRNNKEALQDLLGRIHKAGHTVFVRDFSFLGFPSFRVYIPGLSDFTTISESMSEMIVHIDQLRRCLCQLPTQSTAQLSEFVSIMERVTDEYPGQYCKGVVIGLGHIKMQENSHYYQFKEPDLLFMLIHLRLGNFRKAYGYFARLMETGMMESSGPAGSYNVCSLAYLKLKAENRPDSDISFHLNCMFGSDLAKEVIEDLQPSRAFKDMKLPVCGDCTACPASDQCCYETWKKIRPILVDKMEHNPIDQSALSTLFQNVLEKS